jgi:hypothetical protein
MHFGGSFEYQFVVAYSRGMMSDLARVCKHLGPGRYVSVINDNH